MSESEPPSDGITRFSYCGSHVLLEDRIQDIQSDVKGLERRFGDLVNEQTRLTGQLANNESKTSSLIDEMKEDREDRKKERELLQKNMAFLQDLVTCNNSTGAEERKELIRYGGKVVLILLAAVVGLRIVSGVLGMPFP